MSRLDEELRLAFRREPAPQGFSDRLMARIDQQPDKDVRQAERSFRSASARSLWSESSAGVQLEVWPELMGSSRARMVDVGGERGSGQSAVRGQSELRVTFDGGAKPELSVDARCR